MSWTWRYENADGTTVEPLPPAAVGEAFPSQADAETYVGEIWRELLDQGVAQVTLFEGDRKVYGPMGLDAP
jgi:hypothetical protein